jgi:tetratricopeptide (TPR) repeat protein
MSKNKKHKQQISPTPTPAANTRIGFTNPWILVEKHWLLVLGILLLSFLVYLSSVGHGLVSDDKGLTDPNNFSSLGKIFADPFSSLRVMFYAFIYQLCETATACYRLPTFLAHLGNIGLVFLLVGMVAGYRSGLFASSLFAIHPVLTEGVVWISGGGYVIYSFFFLASLLFYIWSDKARNDDQWKKYTNHFYIASLVLVVIALFSANRLMALPIFFLYEISLGDIKRNWKRLSPFFFMGVIWVAVHLLQVTGRVEEVTGTGNVESWTYNPLFQVPFAVGRYIELMIWPDGLSFYHSNLEVPAVVMIWRWLVLLGLIGLGIWGFFKHKVVFFWVGFFFAALLLYLIPLQLAWLVAERYVYLASIGIFALVGIGLSRLFRFRQARIAILIVFCLLIAALSIRTVVRTIDWRDEDTLMTATLRTNPENAKVHNHIGIIHGKKKDYASAMKEFEIAMGLDPNLAETYHNMGNAFDEQARSLKETDPQKADQFFNSAIPLYEKALSLNPNHWLSYQQLANIYFDKGEYQKTIDYILKILPLNPNPALINNLGFVYLQMGNKEEARKAYSEVLRVDPGNAVAAQALRDLDNPVPPPSSSQTDNPAMPGGQLPPEVLKAIQEQTQRATSSP